MKTVHKWEVPGEGHFMLRAETFLLGFLIVLVMAFSYLIFGERWIPTIISTLVFIAIFIMLHILFRKVRPAKENYHLTTQGLTIKSQTGKKTVTVDIKFRDILAFKLDKLFHGGRIETKKGRHALFFNTLEEILKLEKTLNKKIKS